MDGDYKLIFEFVMYVKEFTNIVLSNCNLLHYISKIVNLSKTYNAMIPSFEKFLKEHSPIDHTYSNMPKILYDFMRLHFNLDKEVPRINEIIKIIKNMKEISEKKMLLEIAETYSSIDEKTRVKIGEDFKKISKKMQTWWLLRCKNQCIFLEKMRKYMTHNLLNKHEKQIYFDTIKYFDKLKYKKNSLVRDPTNFNYGINTDNGYRIFETKHIDEKGNINKVIVYKLIKNEILGRIKDNPEEKMREFISTYIKKIDDPNISKPLAFSMDENWIAMESSDITLRTLFRDYLNNEVQIVKNRINWLFRLNFSREILESYKKLYESKFKFDSLYPENIKIKLEGNRIKILIVPEIVFENNLEKKNNHRKDHCDYIPSPEQLLQTCGLYDLKIHIFAVANILIIILGLFPCEDLSYDEKALKILKGERPSIEVIGNIPITYQLLIERCYGNCKERPDFDEILRTLDFMIKNLRKDFLYSYPKEVTEYQKCHKSLEKYIRFLDDYFLRRIFKIEYYINIVKKIHIKDKRNIALISLRSWLFQYVEEDNIGSSDERSEESKINSLREIIKNIGYSTKLFSESYLNSPNRKNFIKKMRKIKNNSIIRETMLHFKYYINIDP
jgi:hypothetical protein